MFWIEFAVVLSAIFIGARVGGMRDEVRQLAADLGDDVLGDLVAEETGGGKIGDDGRLGHGGIGRHLSRNGGGASGKQGHDGHYSRQPQN